MGVPDFGVILSLLAHYFSWFQSAGLFWDHTLAEVFYSLGWVASFMLHLFLYNCPWLDYIMLISLLLKLNYQNLKVSAATTGFRTLARKNLLRHRVQIHFVGGKCDIWTTLKTK